MCLLTLSTTACNFDFFSRNKSQAPQADNPQSAFAISNVREIASPAKSSDGFGSTPRINIDRSNLEGALGFNTGLLFADNISNKNDRFDRLENAVQNISNTVNDMAPTVNRLKRVEQDLENLTEQLEILLSEDNITPRMHGAHNAAKTNNAPAPTNLAQAIKNMRVADHGGKTRIVIETHHETNYSANVSGNMFTLSYDGALTAMDLNALASKSKLINGVSGSQNGNQASILFQLEKNSALIKEGRIPPNKDNANHRIYLDLRR